MKKTPLFEVHESLGAKIVDFAGYAMPVLYTSIREEHLNVRQKVGLFDLCHMGRFFLKGPQAGEFLHYLVTNNILKMEIGDAHYALVLNEGGTILDDVIVYRLCEEEYLLVCNAANREKIWQWMEEKSPSFTLTMEDRSEEMGMVAIQGKLAEEVVAKLVGDGVRPMKYYQCGIFPWRGEEVIVARTGYTGEDGFELYLSAERLKELWNEALEVGEEQGICPVGLGARDTLRLEAAMPLYGHEITEETNPLEAGLSFAVKFKKGDFIGREALLEIKRAGLKRKLVCLEVEGRRIAREGALIFAGEEQVGHVTSGTFSPTLEKSIAMGYVRKGLDSVGTRLEVEVGRKRYPLTVVKRPFYKRSS